MSSPGATLVEVRRNTPIGRSIPDSSRDVGYGHSQEECTQNPIEPRQEPGLLYVRATADARIWMQPARRRCWRVLHCHGCTVRVYAKAKELDIPSRLLLRYLAGKGCVLNSASCNIPDETLTLIPTDNVWAIVREVVLTRQPDAPRLYPPWPQLVTGTEAALIAEVDPATIRQWVRRGHLVRADLRGRSRNAVYHLDDVLAARRATRQTRRSQVPVYRVPRLSRSTFDAAMTAREAGAYLGIPESTIRSWAHRKRIIPVAVDNRRPRYRLAAIYDLIKSRHRPELDPRKRPLPDWDNWDD